MVKGKAMPRPGDRKEGEQQKELSGATGEVRTHDPQIMVLKIRFELIFLSTLGRYIVEYLFFCGVKNKHHTIYGWYYLLLHTFYLFE